MSKIIQAYHSAIRFLFSHKKIWFMVYGLNVAFAILIAMPLSNYLQSTISDSLSTNKEFMTFNYTYLNDFIHEFGEGLGVVWNQSFYVLIIYFLIAVFISGGIVSIVNRNEQYADFGNFWKGGGKLFWRFFRLSFYYLISWALFGLIGWKIFSAAGLSVFNMENETGIINRFYLVAIILAILFFMISIIHVYAKLEISKSESPWIHQAIISALKKFKEKFWSSLGLALLNVLVLGSISFFYFWFRKHFHFSNSSILLIFVLAQLYVLSRIACRVIRVASFEELSEGNPEIITEK